MTETLNPPIVALRAVVEYQMMGDAVGGEWVTQVLDRAVEQGQILGFEITGSHPGAWGLQLVTFTVDLPLQPKLTHEEAKDAASGLLDGIVGDSVDVRWVLGITERQRAAATAEGLLSLYMDLSKAYNRVDDVIATYQATRGASPQQALSDIAAIIADHESGEDD